MRTHKNAFMMKTYTYTLLAVMLAAVLLTSCLGSDREEVEYSDNCNITSFSLGSIRQAHHMKGSKGQDSTYYTVFSGSYFPMTVNQRDLLIENRDSLPYASLINKVLTNCVFDKVLVHRPKDLAGVDPADTVWVGYSNKDSLDFTKPRSFMVFAADGVSMRQYTVKVNVRQMDPGLTVWDSLGVSGLPAMDACQARRLVVSGGRLTLLSDQGGQQTCHVRDCQKDAQWKEQPMTGAEGLVPESVQAEGDMLYASTDGGKLLCSSNGWEWRSRMLGQPGLRLVGVSHDRFYALVDGRLMSTAQHEENWVEEALDDEAARLPERDIRMISLTQSNGNARLLLAGKAQGKAEGRVWSKTWLGTKPEGEAAAGWAYYSENNAIRHPFPVLREPNILPYDGGIMLFGGALENAGGGSEKDEALGTLYFSEDMGVTWNGKGRLKLDERMQESARKARLITATVEDGRFVWVLVDGQLWRGRVNGVAFQ